jgi:hypothetical protein
MEASWKRDRRIILILKCLIGNRMFRIELAQDHVQWWD